MTAPHDPTHNASQPDALDRGLRAVGEHLPEPTLRPDLAARLTRLVDGVREPERDDAPVPFVVHARRWSGALAAVLVLAALAGVLLNQRAATAPNGPADPAPSATAPTALVSFEYQGCRQTDAMAPKFESLCCESLKGCAVISTISLNDKSPREIYDAIKALGIEPEFCSGGTFDVNRLSGVVVAYEPGSGRVLARAQGDEPIDPILKAIHH